MKFLEVPAQEKSTYCISLSFRDEQGESIIPKSIKWSLTDRLGNIINEQEEVEITETLAKNLVIILSGDDLAFLESELGTALRYVIIEATYTNLSEETTPLRDAVAFYIEDLPKIV